MSSFLANSLFSDIKIISKDKEEFNLHRVILFKNEYFKGMIMLEWWSIREVHLPESAGILKEIFRRIYGGKGFITVNYQELLIAANKYRVIDLETDCKIKIVEELTVNRIISTLIVAEEFGDEALLEEIYQFIGL